MSEEIEASSPQLDIRDVQTIKHDKVFLLCDRYGDIPAGNTAALGLYFMDTRFLSRYELLINGSRPLWLHSEVAKNYSMLIEARLEVESVDPTGIKTSKNISISRHRWLEHGIRETIKFQNYTRDSHQLRVEVRYDADFQDLFEVRGFKRTQQPEPQPAAIDSGAVTLAYKGLDDVRRELEIRFTPTPKAVGAQSAEFIIDLDPQSSETVEVSILPRVGDYEPLKATQAELKQAYSHWRRSCTTFKASYEPLHGFLERAVLDLRMLQTDVDGTAVLDAGVPWYSTLFGRDSLITAYQSLGVNPSLAKGTLRKLAEHQGTKVEEWRDEEPGKILHEIRSGELAATGEIPHTPYYGSIDATPLWLVLYGRTWAWTGDLELAEQLWPNALAALEWIDKHGDSDGDGYVEYEKRSDGGLDNQGWKDSFDGIVHADGSIPAGPIALVEVQGYVYHGKMQAALVAEALGHGALANELKEQAYELKRNFNRDFWLEDEQFFAVALDGNKERVASITSNPGHGLWSGIIDKEKASYVVRKLLSFEMSSGWGIRTLSTKNPAYDPVGYHTGTVWPHDCSLIAHGMKQYGFDDESNAVINQLAYAGSHFPDSRFPELFCGYSVQDAPIPVQYPVACRPQAWSTGAALLMVRTYAGISAADAANRVLYMVRPQLPVWLEQTDIRGMKVGASTVDLRLHLHSGVTGCEVLRKDGDLDVLIRY